MVKPSLSVINKEIDLIEEIEKILDKLFEKEGSPIVNYQNLSLLRFFFYNYLKCQQKYQK